MTRDRRHPRFSITKLAEYLVATAGRRRTLIEDQKYPSAFIAAKWTEAYPAIADVLIHGGDRRVASEYLAQWRRRPPTSSFDAERRALWIEAMTVFAEQVDDLELAAYQFVPGREDAYLAYSGVQLSVRPDLLIGGDEPGALKIYLGKSKRLTPNTPGRTGSGTYAATLMHLWAQDQVEAAPDRCLVLDVFGRRLFTAPAKPGQPRKDALAACQEIADVWSRVTDPRAGGPGTGSRPFGM